ncbi:hypothetical protein SRHO_G00049660 [Serrasalmus rhombeus]
MEHSLTTYSGDVLALQAKAESRSRRQNIVRVPEGETGDIPRPIVARLHYYSDCVEILKRARQRQRITMSGMRFAVFPDYTAKVARACAAFNEARKRLRVRNSLLFPAQLRITYNGTQHLFTSPDKAKGFISSLAK